MLNIFCKTIFYKTLVLFFGAIIAVLLAYHLYFFILPSVTISNQSENIKSAVVYLPDSRLDFGGMTPNTENTIHYDLDQPNGIYHYQIILKNRVKYSGKCGQVSANQIHKRILITLKSDEVVCQESTIF